LNKRNTGDNDKNKIMIHQTRQHFIETKLKFKWEKAPTFYILPKKEAEWDSENNDPIDFRR
jgi:hypothetical protein